MLLVHVECLPTTIIPNRDLDGVPLGVQDSATEKLDGAPDRNDDHLRYEPYLVRYGLSKQDKLYSANLKALSPTLLYLRRAASTALSK